MLLTPRPEQYRVPAKLRGPMMLASRCRRRVESVAGPHLLRHLRRRGAAPQRSCTSPAPEGDGRPCAGNCSSQIACMIVLCIASKGSSHKSRKAGNRTVSVQVGGGGHARGVRRTGCGARRAAHGVRRAACGARRAACGVRRVVCGVRRAACGVRRAAQHATCDPFFPVKASSSSPLMTYIVIGVVVFVIILIVAGGLACKVMSLLTFELTLLISVRPFAHACCVLCVFIMYASAN